jgi:hypothetical protein
MWYILEKVPWAAEKNVYCAVTGYNSHPLLLLFLKRIIILTTCML